MDPDRFTEQLAQISEVLAIPLVAGHREDGGAYIYERDHILVRREDMPDVFPAINSGRRNSIPLPHESEIRAGLYRINVADPDQLYDQDPDGGVSRSLQVIKEIQARKGGPKLAGPNHLIAITTGGVNSCPSDEPAKADDALHPGISASSLSSPKSPVSMVVVDTGLLVNHRDLYPWMTNVVPTPGEPVKKNLPLRPDDPPGIGFTPAGHLGERLSDPVYDPPAGDKEVDDPREDVVREYVGHGTFIAGIIAAIAPHAAVRVSGKLRKAGALDEHKFGHEILETLAPAPDAIQLLPASGEAGHRWPDIISLSAGTTSEDSTELLGLRAFMEELARHPETLLVAAAGNNGSDEPFWPAAFAGDPAHRDAVLSVGALSIDGVTGACFSDHGGWVRVYAPGERLVGAFVGTPGTPRKYRYQHSTFDHCRWLATDEHPYAYDCTCGFPPRVGAASTSVERADLESFTGKAAWSGTSFSTPIVAAMIANVMADNPGLSSRKAAARLLAGPGVREATVRGRKVPALWPPQWKDRAVTPFPPRP
ncbi:S8/S53 family peptidase [Sphaerisporangium corydalis]|uniref:S8/S53 family peptidase n=1 Tax=Sphaerisporangium corydalis TaxID=1441875 RepID=A0ABV9E7B2_9ACTN|nr:S8/S53 family peptidase [Sphaerisporangium corydalis]